MSEALRNFSLPDGSLFPSLGLGTWKIPDADAPSLVQDAVRLGYRHIDCACDYGNEPAVGKGITDALAAGLCARDDLWVTSKLWNTFHRPEHVRAACERSLKDLGLDELDLYLVHFPIALEYVDFDERYPPGWFHDPDAAEPRMKPVAVPYAETWGAMEELQRAGLVKRIGVSNLTVSILRDVLSYASIRPAVHQVEMHPYLTQQKLLRFCDEEGIAVTAFSPIGADSYIPLGMAATEDRVMDNPVVRGIAEAHGRSVVQVLLRWAVQRGTVAIPKTQNPTHLEENIQIYDFELSEDQMASIDALDQHRRFNDPGVFCEAAFNTYYPIFD